VSRRELAAVFALAVAVRVGYVLLFDPVVRPISDGGNYHLLAGNIAHGRGYISPYDWAFLHHARPTAEFAPLHPTLLAGAVLLGLGTILGQQLFLAVVGAITPVLTALLGWRITGDRRIAIAAGVVAAVHPILLGSDGALMPETLYALLGTAVLLTLLRDGRRWALASGLLLGAAVLTRGDGLLLVPIVAVPVLALRHGRVDRRLFELLGLLVVGLLVVVTPWLARNAARFDGQLVLSNNLGSLLNGANCPPSYEGPGIGSWTFTCADRVDVDPTDEVAASAAMRKAGIDYATDHAGRLPVVAVARVARAWGLLHPVGQARAEGREGRVSGVQLAGVVADWFLLPLFALGAWRLRRRAVPLVAMVDLVVALSVVAYGNTRFREIAEPALIVGAMAGIALTSTRRTALTEHS
jgi:4-amino-4-deoxy-L-arabinose transferase-like glycosyltransferase